jgi:repressor LexA
MAEPLTPTERKVYHYLLDFLVEHSYQPSVREIGRRFRLRSTKTVADLLKSLAEKGYIERDQQRSRGVRLKGIGGVWRVQPVPVYARAHAAPPTLRDEDVVTHVALDRTLLPGPDTFLVRHLGDGLAPRGVLNGDLAIVAPTLRVADGGLAAVRLGEWIQVRALEHRGAVITLAGDAGRPAAILARHADFEVLGAVVGAVRPPPGVALDDDADADA